MVYSTAFVAFVIVGLLAGTLLLLEVGRRIGHKRHNADPEDASVGLGAVDGAVFGLMGLLIAFTFSAAASRFDARRGLIVEEANAIGTSYLRLDLLPTSAQPKLREDFRRYVDSRMAVYRALPDLELAKALLAKSTAIQGEIWSGAVAACKATEVNGNAVTSLVLAALNEMIDITTTRTVAAQTHLPGIIFATLCVMVLAGSLFAGYGMAGSKTRSWIHVIGFAILMTVTVYVIFDLEYPRYGFIRVDATDQVLVDVRKSMR